VVALYPGHLTLLSAFFASILFGLGVDYGVHLVDRIEELVGGGLSERVAVPAAVEALAPGLVTGAGTTASVLFAMVFSGFRGFEELGVVAGTGVVLCLLAMVTVLPALLVLWPPTRGRERSLSQRRLGQLLVRFQSRPVAAAVGLLALVGTVAGGPGFDSDYLNLQPEASEAVRLERTMVEESSWSPEFAVFTADDEERARAIVERLVDDETVAAVRSMVELEALGVAEDLPPGLASGLRSSGGRYAIYAYPAEDVWRPEAQERFLEHLWAVDPEVTGMPVLGSFMVDRSRRALRITAALSMLLLVAWVGWDFRRWLPALLAMLPALLTVTSLHALMRLFGVPFNSLNLMALPVVLGVAVDDGVHIVHRFLEERGDLQRTLAGTGRSVLLTSLTTLAAFGTLIFTEHRGLASFGQALALGVAAALVLSVLLLPELLVLCRRRLLASLALGPGGGEERRHLGASTLLPGTPVDQVRDRQIQDAHAEGAEDDGAVVRRRRRLAEEHLAEGGADKVAVTGGLRRQVDGGSGAAHVVEVVDHVVVGQDGLRQ
jgi:predicted RND superfamily exporter protein